MGRSNFKNAKEKNWERYTLKFHKFVAAPIILYGGEIWTTKKRD
jgi:hypothetical protein